MRHSHTWPSITHTLATVFQQLPGPEPSLRLKHNSGACQGCVLMCVSTRPETLWPIQRSEMYLSPVIHIEFVLQTGEQGCKLQKRLSRIYQVAHSS